MKKLSIIMLSLVVASFTANAQREQPMRFENWDPKPQMHPIPVQYFNEHAVVLLQSETRDYKFEGTDITMYSTIHKIVKVLDKRGIEEFNTITVPFRRNESRVDSIRARVILPDGTTRDLKYEMLYIGSGGLFFALDGLEKNAEVELMVKYKSISSYFGSVTFQYDVPVLNTYFELNYPKEMFFNTKGYHGFPSGKEEVVAGHKQVKIYQANIPALDKEKNAYYDLYTMRLEYGIDHFVSRGGYQRGDEFTYDRLAQNMYTRFYDKNMLDRRLPNQTNVRLDEVGFKESVKNSVGKLLTSIGVKGAETDKQKIRMIEDGIKSQIMVYWELAGTNAGENIDSIVANKAASPAGLVKLFCACFRATGIEHELGMVSDRSKHLMDSKFINWAPLEDYVFYFPQFDSYLAPQEPYYRYPEIPYSMINNKGVFCRTNPENGYIIGRDVASADAIVRKIAPNEGHITTCKTTTEISISKDMDVMADVTKSYTGYNAADLREELASTPKEKIKELIQDEIELAETQEDLIRYSTSNESFNAVYQNKPLIVNAIARVPYMIEKAGDRYLVKVGEAMGGTESMYDQKERILPVDLDYPYINTYTISVNIPEGYKLTDASTLNSYIEETDKDNGNTIAYFKSSYAVNGKKLIVTVTESYPKIHYSVRDFGEFKKLVNAAADFNKSMIVLEKEKTVIRKHKKQQVKAKESVKPATPAPVATQNKPVAPKANNKPLPKPTATLPLPKPINQAPAAKPNKKTNKM